jgi:hypothetical protein
LRRVKTASRLLNLHRWSSSRINASVS